MTVTRQQKLLGCVLLAIFPLGFLLYILWSQIFIHDWYLWEFSRSYATVAPPPTTRHLKSYKELGLLVANGNHIDLFVGELRSYTGSRQEIIDWYNGQSVPSRLAPGERAPVEIVFIENGRILNEKSPIDRPSTLEAILDYSTKQGQEDTTLYIVYALDSTGYGPGLDIRGM